MTRRHRWLVGRNDRVTRIDPEVHNDDLGHGWEYIELDDPDRVAALTDIDRAKAKQEEDR